MAAITDTSKIVNRTERRRPAPTQSAYCRVLITALLTLPSAAFAQQWEIEPSLEIIGTYSDNVFIAPPGLEESDFIWQVNPALTIRKDQGRLTTTTRYRLQSVNFQSDSDFNAIFHQLDSNATLAVATDRLFVDFNARIDQTVADPTQTVPASNVVATANIGDVTTANVNPYFVQPLGNSVFVRLDYEYGIGRFDGFGVQTFSNVDDFEQQTGGFYLGTNQQESGFEWSLTYDYRNVDYELVPNFRNERAAVGITIPILRGVRLVTLGGLESDLISSTQAGGTDSDFWEAGFRFNAGDRNLLEIRAGERFFGTTIFGNAQYTGRRLTFSVVYRENPSTSALDGLGAPVAPFSVGDDDPVFDGPGAVDNITIQPVRAEAYVAKILTARLEMQAGRGELFLSWSDEDREFGATPGTIEGLNEGQQAATFGYNYPLGPRTDVGLDAAWTRFGFAGTATSIEVTSITLRALRRIGRQTNLTLSLRHAMQDSTSFSQFGNYDENAIDLGIVFTF